MQDNLLIAAKKGPAGEDAWNLTRIWRDLPLLERLRARVAGRLSDGEQWASAKRQTTEEARSITSVIAMVRRMRIGREVVAREAPRSAGIRAKGPSKLMPRAAGQAWSPPSPGVPNTWARPVAASRTTAPGSPRLTSPATAKTTATIVG